MSKNAATGFKKSTRFEDREYEKNQMVGLNRRLSNLRQHGYLDRYRSLWNNYGKKRTRVRHRHPSLLRMRTHCIRMQTNRPIFREQSTASASALVSQ
jgi:hypothetical protein